MSEQDAVRSEQQEQLELDDARAAAGLASRAWEREAPEAGPAAGAEQGALHIEDEPR